MSALQNLLDLLERCALTDIWVGGWLAPLSGEQASWQKFTPDLMTVYLEFGDVIVRCNSIEQYSYLSMKVEDRIVQDPRLAEDDYCITFAKEFLLRSTDPMQVLKFLGYYNSNTDLAGGIFLAAEFVLGGYGYAESLFLDPQNLFGIRIGKERERERWLEQLGRVTAAGLIPKMEQFVWENPKPVQKSDYPAWLRNQYPPNRGLV